RLSSRPIFACRTPRADSSPRSVAARLRSLPRTDTNTRASPRSGETTTPVTVTMPIRGSFSSPTPWAITARTDSLTRRMRSDTAGTLLIVGSDEQTLAAHEHPVSGGEPPLGAADKLFRVVRAPRDAGDGQRRTLPELVVVDLRDGGTEPVAEV